MSEVLRVCPPEEAFLNIKLHIKCPIKDCDKVVPQSGSLHKHLVKFHSAIQDENDEVSIKKSNNGKGPVRLQTQYHCPRSDCVYGVEKQRHFTNINLLRQHYWKVHAEKKYKCEKCGSGFGMEKDKRAHEERCGTIYKCLTCNCSYRSVEAILTHCRRKGHELPDTAKKKSSKKRRKTDVTEDTVVTSIVQSSASTGQSSASQSANTQVQANVFIVNVVQPVVQTMDVNSDKLLKPILPKPVSVSVVPIAPVTVCTKEDLVTGDGLKSFNQNTALPMPIRPNKKSENMGKSDKCTLNVETLTKSVSTGTQHSPSSPRARRNSVHLQKRRKSLTGTSATSTGIQTSISIIPHKKKCLKNVAQTQTAGDFILKTAMATAEIPIQSESVGTQITPKSKSKQMRSKNTCNIETQTNNMVNPRRRRRKRLYGLGPSTKTDSICQTVDMNVTLPVEQSINSLSKTMVNESAQTVIMVDENSQTVPYHVLQSHLYMYNQNVKSEQEKMQKAYAASKYFQNLDRNILNETFKEKMKNLENENMNAFKILSISEKGGLSVSVNMNENSTENSKLCSFKNKSNLTSGNDEFQQCHNSGSNHTQSTVCDTGVQVSSSHFKSLTMNRTQSRTTAEASTSPSRDENINMKAFESEWINFLTQCDLYIASNRKRSISTHFPTTSADEYSSNSVSSSCDLLVSQNSKTDASTITKTTDSNPSSVGTKTSFSVQTEPIHTNFSQYPTADMQVQTLTSADDIDQLLLNTVCSSIQTDDTCPLMNIHTQTADDFDVFDLFMNNMETQTTDDLLFEGFSLADIETQTPNEIEHNNLQTTAATQTSSGAHSIIQNKSDAANMETQTPYQGLFDFPVNKAQATWHDLDEILSELNKNY